MVSLYTSIVPHQKEIFQPRLQNQKIAAIVWNMMNSGVKESVYNSLISKGVGETDAYELIIDGGILEDAERYISDVDDNVALWGSYEGVVTTASGDTVLI